MVEVSGSVLTKGNILSLIFFSVVNPLMPILPILCISENLDYGSLNSNNTLKNASAL